MASIYNYKQFEDAAKAAGLFDQFSQADLLLARRNPDAGMTLLSFKKDHAAATTDEARALANYGAEQTRSSQGGYTAGEDGTGFYLNAPSPSSFNYDAAPTYTNKYEAEAGKLMQAILNREKFSYNPATDPLYGSYKKQYTREGKRATQDAIGAAAGATGGIPSSYAVTAATQAGDYYAAQMADKVPELEQLAYQKYMNDYQMKLNDLDVVRAAEQSDYAKFLDQLSQYNTDRNFAYGQHLDEIDAQSSRRAEQLEKAMMAAQYGDYSFLEKMGVTPDLTVPVSDTGTAETRYTLEDAIKLSNLGDDRLLAAMGFDPGYNAKREKVNGLWGEYPTGVIPAEVWESYARQGYEEMLTAAGLTREADEQPGGKPEDIALIDGTNASNVSDAVYAEVYEAVLALANGGASRATILAAINNSPLTAKQKEEVMKQIPQLATTAK